MWFGPLLVTFCLGLEASSFRPVSDHEKFSKAFESCAIQVDSIDTVRKEGLISRVAQVTAIRCFKEKIARDQKLKIKIPGGQIKTQNKSSNSSFVDRTVVPGAPQLSEGEALIVHLGRPSDGVYSLNSWSLQRLSKEGGTYMVVGSELSNSGSEQRAARSEDGSGRMNLDEFEQMYQRKLNR